MTNKLTTLEIQSNVFLTIEEREYNDYCVYYIKKISNMHNKQYYIYHDDFVGKKYIIFDGIKSDVRLKFNSDIAIINFVMKNLDRLYYVKNEIYYNTRNEICSLTNGISVITSSRFTDYDYKLLNFYFHIRDRGINHHAMQRYLTLIPKNDYKEYIFRNTNKMVMFLIKHHIIIKNIVY